MKLFYRAIKRRYDLLVDTNNRTSEEGFTTKYLCSFDEWFQCLNERYRNDPETVAPRFKIYAIALMKLFQEISLFAEENNFEQYEFYLEYYRSINDKITNLTPPYDDVDDDDIDDDVNDDDEYFL